MMNIDEGDEDYDWWEENCSVIPPETQRLILVGIIGATVALISVVFNSFMLLVLLRNRRHRRSHLQYLIFLATSDIFLSASYILLFPVNIYMDYFNSEIMATFWWSYMRIMITISHVFIATSAFLICAAAFERYVMISKKSMKISKRHRLLICLVSLIIAIICKGPMYFEVEVVPNLNCTGVTSLTAVPSEFSETEPYKTVYKFWIRNVVSIIIPFITCFYLNFAIMHRLRLQHLGAKLFRFATSEHRKNIRAATTMLVAVTCTYLASNLLNVVVYTWELIDKESLLSESIRPFYTLSSDLVSFLTVCASACRLPIYLTCNARIRAEVADCINNVMNFYFHKKLYPNVTAKRSRETTVRYCDTGTGYMIYERVPKEKSLRAALALMAPYKTGEVRVRSIGTGLDKIVLSVAIGQTSQTCNQLRPPTRTTTIKQVKIREQ